MDVLNELYKYADGDYKIFQKKLMPTVPEDKIIGVRMPRLREIAKRLDGNAFGWEYYEEQMLHGLYIGSKKLALEQRLELLDEFVPRIDNWAVCDCVCSSLKFIDKCKPEFLEYLEKYMQSSGEYELRFAAVVLMDYYLDDAHIDFVIDYLISVKSEYYYVNMGVAWALCTAFCKYTNKILAVLESRALSATVQNMTVSKICDSRRISSEAKEYLKTLRA